MSDVVTRFHYDDTEDRLYIERIQDVEPIVERVKSLKQEWDGRGKDMYFVGTIPNVIVERYCKEQGITYRDFIVDRAHAKRIMNDPDYSRFRVWEGRI